MTVPKGLFSPHGNSVVIRRMGCRDEVSRKVFHAAYVVMADDVTLVALPDCENLQFVDDMQLLVMLVSARQRNDNATLEEIFYFIEMKKMSVVIDDVEHPYHKISQTIVGCNVGTHTPGTTEQDFPDLPNIRDERDDENFIISPPRVNTSVEQVVAIKETENVPAI